MQKPSYLRQIPQSNHTDQTSAFRQLAKRRVAGMYCSPTIRLRSQSVITTFVSPQTHSWQANSAILVITRVAEWRNSLFQDSLLFGTYLFLTTVPRFRCSTSTIVVVTDPWSVLYLSPIRWLCNGAIVQLRKGRTGVVFRGLLRPQIEIPEVRFTSIWTLRKVQQSTIIDYSMIDFLPVESVHLVSVLYILALCTITYWRCTIIIVQSM